MACKILILFTGNNFDDKAAVHFSDALMVSNSHKKSLKYVGTGS